MRNCVAWNNNDSTGTGTPSSNLAVLNTSVANISYSLFQGGLPSGSGNLDGTSSANIPLFVAAGSPGTGGNLGTPGDLHLTSGSPVINAGSDTYAGELDRDGAARLVNTVDMGAYEYDGQ